MYGDNKDCPIRITSIIGFDFNEVETKVKALVEQFNWKIHSRAALATVDKTVYSVILFNLT